MRRVALVLAAVALALLLALSGVAFAQQEGTTTSPSAPAHTEESSGQLRVEKPGSGNPGPLSPAQKLAVSQGYLVPNQGAYGQAKIEAQRKAASMSGTATPPAVAEKPTTLRSWEGIRYTTVASCDSTEAIGCTRYIELINVKSAICDRTSTTPIWTGKPNELR